MRILSLTILAVLLYAGTAFGQNLVPNPSFEDYEACPTTLSLIDAPMGILSVLDWYRPSVASSDYFNSCATSASSVSVPANFAGYQLARTGEGYAGWYGYGPGYREYVEAQLLSPLIAGHDYYVGYWVNLATTWTGYAIDQMGAVFTSDSLDDPINMGCILETPQVVSPEDLFYSDTADWELVSGTFTAAGGERWVSIGNFTPDGDINTDPVDWGGGSAYAYYYLDDVCVFDLDSAAPENIDIHDTVSCDDNELLLEGRAGMDNYLWDDGSTGATRMISLTGTYWVRSIDKENCRMLVDTFHVRVGAPVDPFIIGSDTVLCFASEITLAPDVMPEFGIFTWSDGSHGTSLNATSAGTYWLEVKNGCYSYADTVTIVIAPPSLQLLNNDTLVCAGTEVPVNALGTSQYSYQWIPEEGVSDPYSLNTIITVTEDAEYMLKGSFPGCPDTIVSISFQTEPVPVVSLREDTVVCKGATVKLEPVLAPAFEDYTYTWSPSGVLGTELINNYFVADTSVTYYLDVSTPAGCHDRDSVYIEVYPPMFASAIADTGFCPGDSVMLWANGGKDYDWNPAYGLSDPGIASPVAAPGTSTAYEVYITDKYGCSDTLSVNVEVYPNAVVMLEDSVQIWPGESYELNPQGNGAYFRWFPPSGLSAVNIANPIASPEVRTRYFVTASTEHGCIVKDSIDILVNTESVFDMPNAFVPGNGKNNVFKVSRRGNMTLKHFRVFNRWGNVVFETANIDEGWDGTFNGTPQPAGVYIYSIEAVTNTGRPVSKQGNVTLIR